MSGTGFVAGGLVAISLLASGCMSGRVKTDLLPEADAELKSPSGSFYLAELKFTSTEPLAAATYEKYQAALLPLLRHECLARYPALFSDAPAYSIPLAVQLQTTTKVHMFKTMAWMYGTLLISGVILPAPGEQDDDYTVAIGLPGGSPTPEKTFRRTSYSWCSLLTPAGLIPYPGESDMPKITGTLFNVPRLEHAYLEQLAQQVSTVVAGQVAAQEPEFWTMQPRYAQPAGYPSSSPAATGTPALAPAALPLPTQTAAPF